jgi:putative permease
LKQIAWYTVVIFSTLAGLMILWQFSQPLLMFLLSLAVSAAFRPLIDTLIQRRFPRALALLLPYLIFLGVVIGLVWGMSRPLIRDLEQITNRFTAIYEEYHVEWSESSVAYQQLLASQLPEPEELLGGMNVNEGLQDLLGITTNLLNFLVNLGLILILSLYWSADNIHFERLLLSLIAVNKRSTARLIWRGIEKGTGAYLRSEVIQSLLAGLFLWLGYWLIGLDYAMLLAVFGALVWLIPWFGAVLVVLPVLLIGLSSGIVPAILAALYAVLVLVVMEMIIEPRIFRKQSYSPIFLVLVLLILAEAFGLLGLILAPLVSVVIQISVKYALHPDTSYETPEVSPEETPANLAFSLSERLAETKETFLAQGESPSPEVLSLMQRLENLILDTNRYLDGETVDEKPAAG